MDYLNKGEVKTAIRNAGYTKELEYFESTIESRNTERLVVIAELLYDIRQLLMDQGNGFRMFTGR